MSSTTFKPAIYNEDIGLVFLPLPITTFTLTDSWDSKSHKVPLLGGISTYGTSAMGRTVRIQGQLIIGSSGVLFDELAMWDYWTTFKGQLDQVTTLKPAELFLYYDDSVLGQEEYRKMKGATPVSATLDVGDDTDQVFPYTLEFTVPSSEIFETAEGVA